jgi:hypothetical protein
MKARVVSLLLVLLLFVGAFTGCTLLMTSTGRSGARGAVGSLSVIRTNNETVHLGAGTYRGPLVVDGNKVTVIGAGIGRTVIMGGLRIDGNNNRLKNLSVDGPVRIHGNNNDFRNAELRSRDTRVEGHNNRL